MDVKFTVSTLWCRTPHHVPANKFLGLQNRVPQTTVHPQPAATIILIIRQISFYIRPHPSIITHTSPTAPCVHQLLVPSWRTIPLLSIEAQVDSCGWKTQKASIILKSSPHRNISQAVQYLTPLRHTPHQQPQLGPLHTSRCSCPRNQSYLVLSRQP
jgi:hypothetical protein